MEDAVVQATWLLLDMETPDPKIRQVMASRKWTTLLRFSDSKRGLQTRPTLGSLREKEESEEKSELEKLLVEEINDGIAISEPRDAVFVVYFSPTLFKSKLGRYLMGVSQDRNQTPFCMDK